MLFTYFILLRMCKQLYDQHLDVIQRQLDHAKAPQPHFFAFFPLPQEQGSFGCETERGEGLGTRQSGAVWDASEWCVSV